MGSFERLALGAWAILAGLSCAMKAGFLSLGGLERNVPLCLFRFLTGIACPGCGMGHALLLAFQGKWAASFEHHALGLPLLALWTCWVYCGARNAFRGKDFSEGFPLHLEEPVPGGLVVGAILAVYLLRLSGPLG